jgi:hypothetical protein
VRAVGCRQRRAKSQSPQHQDGAQRDDDVCVCTHLQREHWPNRIDSSHSSLVAISHQLDVVQHGQCKQTSVTFTLAQHNLSKNFRKTVFVIFEAFFPHPNDRLLSPDLRGVVVHSGRAHVWREAQSWSWQSGACAVVCHRTGRLISYTMLTHFMSEKGVFMNTLSQIHKFSEF